MWEIIFGVIPLIFICSAVALMLINFDSVAEYAVFAISSVIRNPHPKNYSNNSIPLGNTTSAKSHFHLNPLTLIMNFFARIYNLFAAIFLPNISINVPFPQSTHTNSDDNYITQMAQHQTQQLNIKSYSAMPTIIAKTQIDIVLPVPLLDDNNAVQQEIILPKQPMTNINPSASLTTIAPHIDEASHHDSVYAPISSKEKHSLHPAAVLKRVLFYFIISTPLFLIVAISMLYTLERTSGTTSMNLIEWLTSEITQLVEKYMNNTR